MTNSNNSAVERISYEDASDLIAEMEDAIVTTTSGMTACEGVLLDKSRVIVITSITGDCLLISPFASQD